MINKKLLRYLLFCYSVFAFGQVPNDFITEKRNTIKFKQIDSEFFIQWKLNDSILTFDHPFIVNGPDAWKPKLVAENKNYLFFRAGCGNPCWIGIILPLYKNGKPIEIHEYIAIDLDKELVAYINSDDNIEILNFKTLKKQYFKPGNCESAFLGYCIHNAYFKNDSLYYNWTPETHINSKKGRQLKYKINWH